MENTKMRDLALLIAGACTLTTLAGCGGGGGSASPGTQPQTGCDHSGYSEIGGNWIGDVRSSIKTSTTPAYCTYTVQLSLVPTAVGSAAEQGCAVGGSIEWSAKAPFAMLENSTDPLPDVKCHQTTTPLSLMLASIPEIRRLAPDEPLTGDVAIDLQIESTFDSNETGTLYPLETTVQETTVFNASTGIRFVDGTLTKVQP